jgi:hypothetical protein
MWETRTSEAKFTYHLVLFFVILVMNFQEFFTACKLTLHKTRGYVMQTKCYVIVDHVDSDCFMVSTVFQTTSDFEPFIEHIGTLTLKHYGNIKHIKLI